MIVARTPWDWPSRQSWLELTFTEGEYHGRLGDYRQVAEERNCMALLLYGSPADDATVRHLTGFTTWWGQSVAVVRPADPPVLCTSAIAHREPAHSNIQTTWIRDLRPTTGEQSGPSSAGLIDQVVDTLPARGRVGYADRRVLPLGFVESVAERRPDLEWVDCSGAVRELRIIKSAEEIALLRVLGSAASGALGQALNAVSSSASELDVAAVAHGECIRRGLESMNFGCFALSGPRTIFKNAWPTARRPRPGEVVVIDLGATLGGYRSDVSRNRFVESRPEAGRRAAAACLEARQDALACIRPGAVPAEVVDAMRDAVARNGLAEWDFSICHGIGMNLVEAPYFGDGASELRPGMVFCVEPIVAPPDVGTLCIEDMVVVTETGYELLTTTPVDPGVSD